MSSDEKMENGGQVMEGRTLRRDFAVVLTGFMALGAFLMDVVYTAAYIFLYGGNVADITVGFYSRSCAFAFLAFTVFGLLFTPETWKRRRRILVNGAYALVIGCILYGVVAENERLLFQAMLVLTLGCAIFALRLLAHRGKARFFALVVILISLLEIGRTMLYLYGEADRVLGVLLLIYLPVYGLLGWMLMGLRNEYKKEPR